MAEHYHDEPDGAEVVARPEDGAGLEHPPLLVLEPLRAHLDGLGIGSGPIEWQRIGEGQSNVTFLLRRGETEVVLRRGPRPPLPPSAHDMVREARVQRLLREAGHAVPRILAIETEPALLGVPFYLMEFVDGEVITDQLPERFDEPGLRRRVSEVAVETLAALHSIDVALAPFDALGRPSGYLARQVDRFSRLWTGATLRDLPEVEELSRWLAAHLPVSARSSLVHGDFRLGNLMYAREDEPRIAAVLDWEMSTLGDPLADLGYLTATWSQHGTMPTSLELSPVTAGPGFLDRQGLVDHYVRLTGVDASALPWYQTLALWKAAIFSEAIYTRWLKGERPGDTSFAPALETGVPRLLEAAGAFTSGAAPSSR